MKNTFPLLICLLLLSCNEDISGENQLQRLEQVSDYNNSLDRWGTLKKINGNSYVYVAGSQSWTGFRTATTIRVFNGEVVERSYEEYAFDEEGLKTVTDSYRETGNQIGTHSKGAAARTMDEVYAFCEEVLRNTHPDHNTLYFETDDQGLMALCGYVPNNCIDDCFEGVRLQSFEWSE